MKWATNSTMEKNHKTGFLFHVTVFVRYFLQKMQLCLSKRCSMRCLKQTRVYVTLFAYAKNASQHENVLANRWWSMPYVMLRCSLSECTGITPEGLQKLPKIKLLIGPKISHACNGNHSGICLQQCDILMILFLPKSPIIGPVLGQFPEWFHNIFSC